MSTFNALTTSQINNLFPSNSGFSGAFAADRMPSPKAFPWVMIVNTDPHDEPGEHWVTIVLKDNHKAVYFDSFGFPPLVPQIQRYLELNAFNGIKFNCSTLQHPNTTSCGYWCVLFVHHYLKGWSLKKFISFFSGRLGVDLVRNERKLFKYFRHESSTRD